MFRNSVISSMFLFVSNLAVAFIQSLVDFRTIKDIILEANRLL